MILITHILVALFSVAFASYLLFNPSRAKFLVSYGLITSTLTTGTILTFANASHLVHACVPGLIYVSIVTVLTVKAHKTFVAQNI